MSDIPALVARAEEHTKDLEGPSLMAELVDALKEQQAELEAQREYAGSLTIVLDALHPQLEAAEAEILRLREGLAEAVGLLQRAHRDHYRDFEEHQEETNG